MLDVKTYALAHVKNLQTCAFNIIFFKLHQKLLAMPMQVAEMDYLTVAKFSGKRSRGSRPASQTSATGRHSALLLKMWGEYFKSIRRIQCISLLVFSHGSDPFVLSRVTWYSGHTCLEFSTNQMRKVAAMHRATKPKTSMLTARWYSTNKPNFRNLSCI